MSGLPVATGWLFVMLALWLLLAYFAHEKQSVMLTMFALTALLSGILGCFWYLAESEFASASHGPYGASAPRYGGAKNVGDRRMTGLRVLVCGGGER